MWKQIWKWLAPDDQKMSTLTFWVQRDARSKGFED